MFKYSLVLILHMLDVIKTLKKKKAKENDCHQLPQLHMVDWLIQQLQNEGVVLEKGQVQLNLLNQQS